ncbi:hypothetical protein WICPIJ_007059 [Wickerhamomyces pijperi]|uniref:BHLH domain-containing protein n=1 Tax=Wickerhamomyces pijperi TaxID=599730 RepID=A0A9P8Q0L4_WICPI|nr:hypothetical protein WICPIJ_007059 [Wickerhamomyces pijperi]
MTKVEVKAGELKQIDTIIINKTQHNSTQPTMSAKLEDDVLDFKTLDAQTTQPLKQQLSTSLSKSLTVNEDSKIHKAKRKSTSKVKSEGLEDDDEDDDDDKSKKKDNINEKIQEMLTLVPDTYFTENKDRSSGTKDGKPNKGQILTKGVEFLQDLQNKIDENNRREVELIWKLKKLIQVKNQPLDINLQNTSAEMILAEIGVGPLASNATATTNTGSGSAQTNNRSNKKATPNNNFEYGGYDQYS